MATVGMEELDMYFSYLQDNETYGELIATVAIDHKKQAMEILANVIRSVCSNIIPKEDGGGGDDNGVVDGEDPDGEDIDEMELLRRRRAKEQTTAAAVGVNDIADPVQSEVYRFFNQSFDPRAGMQVETHSLLGQTKYDWAKQEDPEWPLKGVS